MRANSALVKSSENSPANPFDCDAAGCDLGAGLVDVDDPANGYGDVNGRISRWEVYNYEMTDYPNNLPEFEYSMCYYEPPDPAAPDRRVLGVAVGNCNAIIAAGGGIGKNKNKPLPLAGTTPAVNVFLSEAIGELTDNAWYGELIDPAGGNGANITAVNLVDRIVLYR